MFYSPSSAIRAPVIIRRASTLSRLLKTEEEEVMFRWPNRFGFSKVHACPNSDIQILFEVLRSQRKLLTQQGRKKWPVTKHNLFDFSLEDSGNPDEWYVTVSNLRSDQLWKEPRSDQHFFLFFFLLLISAWLWNVHTIKRVSGTDLG